MGRMEKVSALSTHPLVFQQFTGVLGSFLMLD